jgi:hypothetical protein
MRKLCSQIAIVLLLLAGIALADDLPMQSFASAEGRFSILFSGTPHQASQQMTLKNGDVSTLYQFDTEADNGDVSYIVMYNDYSAAIIGGRSAQDLLAATRNGAVAGKTLLTDTVIALNGVPGRAYTATDKDDFNFDVHEFLAGNRFYQLIITTKKGHTATQRDPFMNSFRIF